MIRTEMNGEILQKIKTYLTRVRPLFKSWFLRMVSENWKIKIQYKTYYGDFERKETIKKDNPIEAVIDFVIDCYFYFEWDWEKKNSEELAVLLCIAPSTVRGILFKIYNKIRDEWEPFLS